MAYRLVQCGSWFGKPLMWAGCSSNRQVHVRQQVGLALEVRRTLQQLLAARLVLLTAVLPALQVCGHQAGVVGLVTLALLLLGLLAG